MRRRPSLLVRWLRRSPRRATPASAPACEAVVPGPAREEWLVVAAGDDPHQARARRVATALAEAGHATTYVSRQPKVSAPAGARGLQVLETWSLPALCGRFRGSVDRVRAWIGAADAETIALARELGEYGIRVVYDAPVASGPAKGWYEAETERALIDAAEDLIAADASTARRLSSAAGGGRLVHVLPDSPDGAEGRALGAALARVVARPSTFVLLATSADPVETIEAAIAFERARRDGAYRLAVVASASERGLEPLEEMEEERRLRLLRCARPGWAAAWNLGMAASRSEVVALVHASQRPDGAGWLAPALEALASRRELGAVGLRARLPPGVPGAGAPASGDARLRVPALDAMGLVAPRSALRRCDGLDESLGALAAIDVSFRLRDLGYDLALCPALGLRGGAATTAATTAAEAASDPARELRRRWAHRASYLAGRVD